MSNLKENDYTCGNCKHYDRDNDYCMASGNHEIYEEDTCEYWEDDKDELTDEEKREIVGDRKAHEIMEEGREIE